MANQTLGIPTDNKIGMGTGMSDMASRVTAKAADLGHKVANAIDTQRGPAASGLDTAAASLHAGADKLPPQAAPLVRQAADKLGATAAPAGAEAGVALSGSFATSIGVPSSHARVRAGRASCRA